jgi:hypothetical protein
MTVCRLTDTDDVELETTLQELALDLGGDAVETDMALGGNGAGGNGRHLEGIEGQLVGSRSGSLVDEADDADADAVLFLCLFQERLATGAERRRDR